MEFITAYPKDEKQKSLLEALLKEMKISYATMQSGDEALMTEEEFYAKLDKSIHQAEEGKAKILPEEKQKEFLGL